MKPLFESTTLKLTGWYLLSIMFISLLFSVIIFSLSSGELESRLGAFESRIEGMPSMSQVTLDFSALRDRQIHESQVNLFFALFYLNLSILAVGGIGSYLLARRSLKPIEASHEAQSRFTSDASHELRTPLAVMKSELEVALRSKQLSKQDMHELIESNLEEVNRLAELSEMLLQISKHEEVGIEKQSVSLAAVTTKIRSIHSIDEKRIELVIDAAHQYMLHANEASIKELLMILLDNALRYSPSDSKVTIQLEEDKKVIRLKITNSGKGIDPNDMPHIFERFYRADKSRTQGQKIGYGLGLSLAKKIADIHSAVISVSSQAHKKTDVEVTFKK